MRTQLNIEISTHCNYRCVFCPVSANPKRPAFMSNELFEKVLDAAASLIEQGKPEWVALNHYGEPTLPKTGLLVKAAMLAERGWPLRLFTNASHLDARLNKALAGLGNLEAFIINLPSLDPVRYHELTGKDLDLVLHNVDAIVAARLPFAICLNVRGAELEVVTTAIVERWPDAEAFANRVNSRSGAIENALVEQAEPWTEPRLPGCGLFDKQLNVNVNGVTFMCCHDYEQKYLGGWVFNASSGTHTSTGLEKLRSIIFGAEDAPADMICRKCIRLIRPTRIT